MSDNRDPQPVYGVPTKMRRHQIWPYLKRLDIDEPVNLHVDPPNKCEHLDTATRNTRRVQLTFARQDQICLQCARSRVDALGSSLRETRCDRCGDHQHCELVRLHVVKKRWDSVVYLCSACLYEMQAELPGPDPADEPQAA